MSDSKSLLLPRFHHAAHSHKLFQTITRNISIFCDNANCARRILNGEVSYVCFKCDFDLCAHCFMLPADESSVVQLAPDDKMINEDVLFKASRYNTFAEKVRIEREISPHDEDNTLDVQNLQHLMPEEDMIDMEEDEPEENGDGDITEPDEPSQPPPQPLVQPSEPSPPIEHKEEEVPVQVILNNPTYDAQTNTSVNNLLANVRPRIRMRRSTNNQAQSAEQQPHQPPPPPRRRRE